jgi:hypothetical protein
MYSNKEKMLMGAALVVGLGAVSYMVYRNMNKKEDEDGGNEPTPPEPNPNPPKPTPPGPKPDPGPNPNPPQPVVDISHGMSMFLGDGNYLIATFSGRKGNKQATLKIDPFVYTQKTNMVDNVNIWKSWTILAKEEVVPIEWRPFMDANTNVLRFDIPVANVEGAFGEFTAERVPVLNFVKESTGDVRIKLDGRKIDDAIDSVGFSNVSESVMGKITFNSPINVSYTLANPL